MPAHGVAECGWLVGWAGRAWPIQKQGNQWFCCHQPHLPVRPGPPLQRGCPHAAAACCRLRIHFRQGRRHPARCCLRLGLWRHACCCRCWLAGTGAQLAALPRRRCAGTARRRWHCWGCRRQRQGLWQPQRVATGLRLLCTAAWGPCCGSGGQAMTGRADGRGLAAVVGPDTDHGPVDRRKRKGKGLGHRSRILGGVTGRAQVFKTGRISRPLHCICATAKLFQGCWALPRPQLMHAALVRTSTRACGRARRSLSK